MAFHPATRLRELPPYLFVEIDRKKREAFAAGRDVIDFGVGDPDLATHDFIVDRAAQAVRDPANHRYALGIGRPDFRGCIAEFFSTRYGVKLSPDDEILALLGSKEGLGHLALAVVNPGDTALIPDPAYPVYRSGTIFAGGRPYTVPLTGEHGWLPDLEAIPTDVARAAAVFFLNYPNNPTGAVADLAFFERLVDFGRRHDIVIAHDAAYNEMYLCEDDRPPSILQVRGARDVAVELHSASKTFNMTGWRVAFAAGNRDVLAALARIKANLDSGVFGAIQDAACAAYAGINRPELTATRRIYRERAEALTQGLRAVGFEVAAPRATFYVWARVPDGYDSMELAARLLDQAAIVCIPGAGFGKQGRDHVRFALTVEIDRVRAAVERMRELDW